MSGMSGWFMLQPNGEILDTPIGWLTTLATLSNKPANQSTLLEVRVNCTARVKVIDPFSQMKQEYINLIGRFRV